MLLRSANGAGYASHLDNVVQFLTRQAAAAGVIAVLEAGALYEDPFCYIGDLVDFSIVSACCGPVAFLDLVAAQVARGIFCTLITGFFCPQRF
jgi:hypothetical protein